MLASRRHQVCAPCDTHPRSRFAAGALQKAKGKPLLRVLLVAGALVLEFEAEADRDQVVDVLTPLMKRAGGAAHPGDATGRGAEAPGPLSTAKQQLLGEDGYALPSVRGVPHARHMAALTWRRARAGTCSSSTSSWCRAACLARLTSGVAGRRSCSSACRAAWGPASALG